MGNHVNGQSLPGTEGRADNGSVAEEMKVNLTVNPQGKAWIMHKEPLHGEIDWVEYDIDEEKLLLVGTDGGSRELGLRIHDPMREYLEKATELYVVWMDNDDIRDVQTVPLMIKQGDLM